VALAQALADSPSTILQTLADTILEVLQSDSAGVSLLTPHDGGKTFYWPAIAGAWQPHIGGGTPRDFGPCGDVLDRNIPLLFKQFERRYTYFQPVTPPTEECLLVPFYVAGTAVGTIWAITHNDRRQFDAEDQRQLVSLGRFASAAYQTHIELMGIGREADVSNMLHNIGPGLGATYTLARRVADAMSLLTQALDQILAQDMGENLVFCRLSLGEAHLLVGHLEEAYALAEQARAFAHAHQERGHEAYALHLLGE
jgi:hypothetical protein